MENFIANITSFPTAIYTVMLIVCVVLILLTIIGAADLDFDGLDVEIDGLDVDADIDGNVEGATNVLTGFLVKNRLVGVPITISLTLLTCFGWLMSYYIVHFLVPFESGSIMRYLVGLPIFLGTLFASAKLTGIAIGPIRRALKDADKEKEVIIIGQTAVVRSSKVDNSFGEATLDDGGAGLILKVRTKGAEEFSTGDKVVLFELMDSQNNIYRVISEEDFILRSQN